MKKYVLKIAIIISAFVLCTLHTVYANVDANETKNLKVASSSTKNNTVEDEEQRNNYLKTLEVVGYEMSPTFTKYTNTYYVSIPSDVKALDINAIAENNNANIKILGNTTLTKNENQITVTVIPPKGVRRTYTIIATKQKDNGLNLEKLEIEGVTLNPEFSTDKFSYSFNIVQQDIKPFNIIATPNISTAKVEILGNDESLVEGDNIITILLTNSGNTTVYQITATISKNKEQQIITYVDDNNFISNIKDKVFEFFKDSNRTLALLVAVAVLLVILIVILIAKIAKKNKVEKNKQKIKNRAK